MLDLKDKKKNLENLQYYLFNFMASALALPPDGISICFHRSQYFPVSLFEIDFYVGHVNSI